MKDLTKLYSPAHFFPIVVELAQNSDSHTHLPQDFGFLGLKVEINARHEGINTPARAKVALVAFSVL